jgi:hypothetical protein
MGKVIREQRKPGELLFGGRGILIPIRKPPGALPTATSKSAKPAEATAKPATPTKAHDK